MEFIRNMYIYRFVCAQKVYIWRFCSRVQGILAFSEMFAHSMHGKAKIIFFSFSNETKSSENKMKWIWKFLKFLSHASDIDTFAFHLCITFYKGFLGERSPHMALWRRSDPISLDFWDTKVNMVRCLQILDNLFKILPLI